MNGNVTKDGIAKDLAWMKRVGIGGLQNFDANLATPQVVDRRLVYMTPEWKDAFRFAASEAARLDLELTIASSPGWSETGGPWVNPGDGMKKLTWSETQITGGAPFTGKLSPPPATTGQYRDLPAPKAFGQDEDESTPLLQHYVDVAVLAYPAAEEARAEPATITSSDGKPVDAATLIDDSLTTGVPLPGGTATQPGFLMVSYQQPQTVRSVSLLLMNAAATYLSSGLVSRLEASDDGQTWRNITDVPADDIPTTLSFAPVTARHFRVLFVTPAAQPPAFSVAPGVDLTAVRATMGPPAPPPRLAELRFSTEPHVNRFENKAGFSLAPDYYGLDADVGPNVEGVRPATVIDLTPRLRTDGSLDWTPPKGSWRVIRLGWSLTGKTNHPATMEATGLEVDKLDAAAVRRYLEHYLATYRSAAGPELIGQRGVRALLTDSTEVGAFNWTPGMIDHFKRLRGYDPMPWLPALTGVIIGSRARSDAFLYDYRRTIADLHASAHYETIAQVAHENGLKVYGEALEAGRPSLGDDMAMRRYADIPMAAQWYSPSGAQGTFRADMRADLKGAASVAHVYGQNIAAAESMTSVLMPWATGPAELRHVIDLEFANGINRPVIHTSVHQPVDDKVPGQSLGRFGLYFNRHETWAEMAKPWIDYIARNAFMLQQGRDVADIAYFYGEEAPLVSLFGNMSTTDAPTRHGFDFVNADVLVNQLSVDTGTLVSKSGARYRLLFLGGSSRRMTLPTLRRLAELAEAGAVIAGQAPTGSPSLPDETAEYAALVSKLWSGQPMTRVGAGRVLASDDMEAALASLGVRPDFAYAKPQPDSAVVFVHRRVKDGDIYFLNNRRNRPETIEGRFRVTGKAPQIWRADTGTVERVSYRVEGDETVVPLEFGAEDSYFVVFREPATAPARTVAPQQYGPATVIPGPWTVRFEPGRGAPASLRLGALSSLSEQKNPGVKYFSGVATYTTSFDVLRTTKAGTPLRLDLGKIADVAEVRVNGAYAGTVWHAPYRLDIGALARRGRNTLEVRVANLWVNRLIGDKQPGASKVTYTSFSMYNADAPLRPSGLIGPVTIEHAGAVEGMFGHDSRKGIR